MAGDSGDSDYGPKTGAGGQQWDYAKAAAKFGGAGSTYILKVSAPKPNPAVFQQTLEQMMPQIKQQMQRCHPEQE